MKKYKIPLMSLVIIGIIYLSLGYLASQNAFYAPTTTRITLEPYAHQTSFSEEDYAILFEQTGLAAPIIDVLATSDDFYTQLLEYQESYLRSVQVEKTHMNYLTRMDQTFDADGNTTKSFKLAPYENGYIFLSKSTYTANWRHGHAGLVVDAVRGKVLESLEPGTVSVLQNASRWEYYPTFKMLRLKDTPRELQEQIATYAYDNLQGIPYNILVMKNAVDDFSSTHCSFIVWQAFKAFGIDLDATGGLIISPQDIAASPHLEVLQIFGFEPDRVW